MINILISAFFVIANYVQPPPSELGYCKLKWEYFSIKEPKDNTVSETVTAIGYNYDGDNKVDVFCSFDKEESFVSKKGKTAYILNHEQRHFDITYAFAKKLIGRIKDQKQLSDNKVEALYNEVVIEKDRFQELYDTETRNSEDKEKQALWDVKIDKLLN